MTVTTPTGPIVFDLAKATDEETFSAAGMRTRTSLKLVDPSGLAVRFRSDPDGSKREYIIEWGDMKKASPSHLGCNIFALANQAAVTIAGFVGAYDQHVLVTLGANTSAKYPVKSTDTPTTIAAGLAALLNSQGVLATSANAVLTVPGATNLAVTVDGLPVTVEISENGTVVHTETLRHQWWLSRWRWPNAVQVANPAWMPAWMTGLYAKISTEAARTAGSLVAYAAMGLAGLTAYIPQTGERGEIGPFTNDQAEWAATGNPVAYAAMMAQAEAAGSWPWNVRDSATGAAVDWNAYPKASTYDNQSLVGPPKVNMLGVPAPDNVVPDAAHCGALWYLPCKVSGDPYYLEGMQLAFAWLLAIEPNPVIVNGQRIIRHDQVRTFAWTLRTLFHLVDATPDVVPSWLLPKSYYRKLLDAQLVWFEANFVNGTDPLQAAFFSGPTKLFDATGNTVISFWQEDYLSAVLGVGCLMGFSEWLPSFKWKIKSTLARMGLSGSGWPRTQPSFYYAQYQSKGGVPATSWADLAAKNAVTAAATDAVDWTKVDANYVAFVRGVLALAVRNGVAEAQAPFAWLDPQVRAHYLTRRWSFASA